MIFAKSFVNTVAYVSNVHKDTQNVVNETTEEMNDWIDDMEENVKIAEKDTGKEHELKIISTSTQLVVCEAHVTYVITAVAEIRQK